MENLSHSLVVLSIVAVGASLVLCGLNVAGVRLAVRQVYPHAHHLKPWRGEWSAWLLVPRYVGVMLTCFAVNILIAGPYSHAGV